jgi:outer membrane lipoprotein LolB
MPMHKTTLLRLLPLASLVLTACSTFSPTTGPSTSPTSPQWRAHEQQVKKLDHYQTRGSFAYITDKCMRTSFGSSSHLRAIACC